jgi:hypothetical protein
MAVPRDSRSMMPAPVSFWNRTTTIGLAKLACSFCHGYGMRPLLSGVEAPCSCVFRAIFRACYRRYWECVCLLPHTNGIIWGRGGGQSGYRAYSRPREEFTADFCLVGRRMLEEMEYQVFQTHYLERADWRTCCGQLKINRGQFFHYVYCIEDELGRVFAELRPYPLFPLSGYFEGLVHAEPQSLPFRSRWSPREEM